MTPHELRAYRATHNISQTQLGERLAVSQRVVSAWETGRTAVPTNLASRLSTPVDHEARDRAFGVIMQALAYIKANDLADDDATRAALKLALI